MSIIYHDTPFANLYHSALKKLETAGSTNEPKASGVTHARCSKVELSEDHDGDENKENELLFLKALKPFTNRFWKNIAPKNSAHQVSL